MPKITGTCSPKPNRGEVSGELPRMWNGLRGSPKQHRSFLGCSAGKISGMGNDLGSLPAPVNVRYKPEMQWEELTLGQEWRSSSKEVYMNLIWNTDTIKLEIRGEKGKFRNGEQKFKEEGNIWRKNPTPFDTPAACVFHNRSNTICMVGKENRQTKGQVTQRHQRLYY